MNKKSENQKQTYTTIQRLDGEKMVMDVLDMTQQEFEKLVKQYSSGDHSEQKYVPFTMEDAQKRSGVGEDLIGKGSVRTEGFEKAVVFLMSLTEQIWRLTQEHKSFRMELFYNAETLKTNYCFFAPTDKPESDDMNLELLKSQD